MKLSAALLILAAAGAAHGQLIVGNDQSGSATIWYVDVNSGVSTALYTSTGNEAKPWGMAYDASNNTLYWGAGGSLYKSAFSLGGLSPSLIGTMTFNGATTNFVGMGFRNGALVGTRNIATEAVYTINTTTAVATQGWVHPSTFDFGGLEVDPVTGALYGLSDSAPAGSVRGLYKLDDANQTFSFIAGYPGAETDIDGLAVYNNRAYYVTDGPNTVQPFFYVYDVTSGLQIGTLPSPFTGSGTFSAATFIPTPGVAAIGLLGVLTLRRRR